MRNVKRMLSVLLLVVVLGTLMTTAVLADEDPGIWLSVTQRDGKVIAKVVTNATVASGQVTLTYDSSALTYQGMTVNEGCVSQHAVNAQQAGTVKIAWVAPGEYAADSKGLSLMEITFTGTDAAGIAVSITAQDTAGNAITTQEDGTIVPPTEEPVEPGPGDNSGDNSDTGDDSPLTLIFVVMGLCLVGIIVVVVILIRKGRKS